MVPKEGKIGISFVTDVENDGVEQKRNTLEVFNLSLKHLKDEVYA